HIPSTYQLISIPADDTQRVLSLSVDALHSAGFFSPLSPALRVSPQSSIEQTSRLGIQSSGLLGITRPLSFPSSAGLQLLLNKGIKNAYLLAINEYTHIPSTYQLISIPADDTQRVLSLSVDALHSAGFFSPLSPALRGPWCPWTSLGVEALDKSEKNIRS
nr:hypothetical protein [Tanacetum cinerariifolium]